MTPIAGPRLASAPRGDLPEPPPSKPSPQPRLALELLPTTSPSERRFRLEGVLSRDTAGQASLFLIKGVRSVPKGGRVVLELQALTSLDSVGVAVLIRLWRLGQALGFSVQLEGVSPEICAHLSLYEVLPTVAKPPESPGALETLGGKAYEGGQEIYRIGIMAADVTFELVILFFTPWRMRWAQLTEQLMLIGSNAAGIVALITFLVGLTLAFQSAYQLRQFGAAIYVASLTAISMVREMGPLITAILVAGRSGSSITSEVATMRVNEEIDAMQVIGIPFVPFVAVPRVLALMITLPLLTLIADSVGILGGWLVGVLYLDLSSSQYISESIRALVIDDLIYSMLKVITFAWGIGIIALHQGYQVQGGAREVGIATTQSVVYSIFFIIMATSVFSIVYYILMA